MRISRLRDRDHLSLDVAAHLVEPSHISIRLSPACLFGLEELVPRLAAAAEAVAPILKCRSKPLPANGVLVFV
jgi:hypothetical protein